MNTLPYYQFSKIPFPGFRGEYARQVLQYIVNEIVRDRGILTEHDRTYVCSEDITVANDCFEKVYKMLYASDLSCFNFNLVLYDNNSNLPLAYARSPTRRNQYLINEPIPLNWTVFTLSKIIHVPLGLFVLLSGKLDDIKHVMDLVIEVPKICDLTKFHQALLFSQEFERYVRYILMMPKQISYPTASYVYLRTKAGMFFSVVLFCVVVRLWCYLFKCVFFRNFVGISTRFRHPVFGNKVL